MTTRSGPKRRHLASSPFKPDPEPVIETFEVDNRVSHDSYGVGRVVSIEAGAVTVDFGSKTVRIVSPYRKLEHL
jgi:hypothetical protein